MDRNHEGYTDHTACEAIRRVERQRRKERKRGKAPGLTYHLNEVQGFSKVENIVCG